MKKLIYLILFSLSAYVSYAQYGTLDQISAASLFYNPAFTGYAGTARFITQYQTALKKREFNSFEKEYPNDRHAYFSFDHYFNKPGLGVGVVGMQEDYFQPYEEWHIRRAGVTLSKKVIAKENFRLIAGAGIIRHTYENIKHYNPGIRSIIGNDPADTLDRVYNRQITKSGVGILVQTGKITAAFGGAYPLASNRPDDYWENINDFQFLFVYQESFKNDKWGLAGDLNYFRKANRGGTAYLGTTLRYWKVCIGAKYKAGALGTEAMVYCLGYRGKTLSVNLSHSITTSYHDPVDFWEYPSSVSIAYQFARKEGKQQLNMTPLLPF